MILISVSKATTRSKRVRETYVGDHLPSGLISLSVIGPLLFLLQNPFPGRAILECKFADDPAELVDVHLSNCIGGMAHKEQKGVKSAGKNNSDGSEFTFEEPKLLV